ncbi:MAG: hypothetical protein [crAssphage sp. isolate ctcc615]|uniref:Uncharacterized protein n=1 Tax=crAssphage sp. isolate ctcc615 TaxID=2989853 RepID=A0A345BNZ6_9CAUD|nr:MAG: hypothetical protein KNU00_gp57 [crAssphage sp. isolate ctcc615]AXF52167.1 MAG: hypothetical protein [crAssphage sp. isolate ctcc615]
MNHTVRFSILCKCSMVKERKMLNSNNMTVYSLITTEILTVRKTTFKIFNHLITKRSSKSFRTSLITHSLVEIFHKTFTSHKNYFHRTSIGIFIENITNCAFNLIQSKNFTISIIVRLTTDLHHTSSMRNRLSIIRIDKKNFSILITIIFSKPQTLFIHNTKLNIVLTHFFINPKIGSTATFSLKLISNNNIRNITCNFFRITMELKLRSHLTRTHNITPITFRIRFTNGRSSHRPIFTYSKIAKIDISIRIGSCKLKTINKTTMRAFSTIFHNTNLSMTIRSNQTILFNKPMSSKLNFKNSTTFTRSSITCVKPKNVIVKFHTTHSFPSPLNRIYIFNTSSTLTLCKESKRKSIIVHTISVCKSIIYFLRFRQHKMSNGFLIRITTVIIITTRYFSKFIHTYKSLN